jgi:hypothetical protein
MGMFKGHVLTKLKLGPPTYLRWASPNLFYTMKHYSQIAI